MFIPDINPQDEHNTVKTLDALDVVCEHCESNTKCNKCPINTITDNINNILIQLVPLPDDN